MTRILAIDPGTTQSGWVLYDYTLHRVFDAGVMQNPNLLGDVINCRKWGRPYLAIEMIESQGMAVGKETFETVVWIGRFMQAYFAPDEVLRIGRGAIKLHICGQMRAKDGNVRQAVIDMFEPSGGGKVPQVGTIKQPGPLYGVSSHAWQALALAITTADRIKQRGARRRIQI